MSLNVYQIPTIEIPLVNKFYKGNNARGKAKRHDNVWVAKTTEIIAACKVQTIGSHYLLTGLMVSKPWRNKKIGQMLISRLLINQEKSIYTFPYISLVPWYLSLGFKQIELSEIPDAIQEKFAVYHQQGRNISVLRYKPRSKGFDS